MTYAFYAIVFLVSWRLLVTLRRDFHGGLCLAALLLVMLPSYAVFVLPWPLPGITFQRIILVELWMVWLRQPRPAGAWKSVPLMTPFIWLIAVSGLSVLHSPDVIFSLKTFLAFSIEVLLFYVIVATSTRAEDVAGLVRAMALGLVIVAVLAVVERYSGYNPVDNLPGYVRKPSLMDMVLATYPHRILLGAAMAMGFPMVFGLMDVPGTSRWRRRGWWLAAILYVAADYFSDSRGPWLGLAVGIGALIATSSGLTRKRMFVLVLMAFALIMARPGIWESLNKRAEMTMDTDSEKGQTYLYRWELWRKALREISKSPVCFVVGYGPGSTEVMDLTDTLSYTGESWNFNSWDNHYATDLIEVGVAGFALNLFLDLAALTRLFALWRGMRGPPRDLMAGMLSSAVILVFMKSNVKIFAPQLNYIFWTLVASGLALGKASAAGKPKPVPVAGGGKADA